MDVSPMDVSPMDVTPMDVGPMAVPGPRSAPSRRPAVAPWRLGPTWPATTLRAHLRALNDRPVTFDVAPSRLMPEEGWIVDGIDARIGREPPGPPLADGTFARARRAIVAYEFSDPRLVRGHFDRTAPLLGRNMLLEAKVVWLRFLVGVRVAEAREARDDGRSVFVFHYDALDGHVVRGAEWFMLAKDHRTGALRFRIEAHWRHGRFPTWWSELGFRLFGRSYRALWRRLAVRRLRRLARAASPRRAR